jgi:hypothetical protein
MAKFQRTYGYADFGITSDKTCVAGQWNVVGRLVVPAGQLITFGANEATSLQGGSGAPVYLRFDNSSGQQLHGVVRFAITNATQTRIEVVAEFRTEKLSADSSTYLDRNKAALLPEGGVYAGKPLYAQKDSQLQILFYPDSSSNVVIAANATNGKALIPVTIIQ